MKRVTDEKNAEFHILLNRALDKLESNKNKLKPCWSTLSALELSTMLLIEIHELQLAQINGTYEDKNSEIDDIINIAMMYKDNLYEGLI